MSLKNTHPTQDLEKDLAIISDELENELLRAERELELEHAHLLKLIDNNNPELKAQMNAMEDSLNRLFQGLEKTRMYLQLAQGESYIIRQELMSPRFSRKTLHS